MRIKNFVIAYHEKGLMPENFNGYFAVLINFNSCTNKESDVLHIFKYALDAKRFFVKKFGKVPCYLCKLSNDSVKIII